MSHPPGRAVDVENNSGKGGKPNRNEKKKVLINLNFNKYINT